MVFVSDCGDGVECQRGDQALPRQPQGLPRNSCN